MLTHSRFRATLTLWLLACACTDRVPEPSRRTSGGDSPPASASAAAPPSSHEPLDASALGERLGTRLTVTPSGALGAVLPRAPLGVSIDGAAAPKSLDLGTSIEFRRAPSGALLTGRVALLEDEVSPALDTLLAHGIQVVGLHQRTLFDEPRVLLMHFRAEGNAALLASGVQSIGSALRDARQRSATPLRGLPGDAPVPGSLDAGAIGGALGAEATGRDGEVVVSLREAPDSAGALASDEPLLRAIWVGSDVRAAVDGTLVLRSAELQPVLGGLRRGNLHVTALHPDASEPSSLRFFVFFRGKGTSLDLVRGVRTALDARSGPR